MLVGSAAREAGAQVAPVGGRLYGDGCYYATLVNPVIPPGQPGSAQLVRQGCRVLAPNGRFYYVDDQTRIWHDEVTGHQLARNQQGDWFILSSAGWTRLLRGAPDGDGPPPPMPLPPQAVQPPVRQRAQPRVQQQPIAPPAEPPVAARTQAVPETPQQLAPQPAPQPAQQPAQQGAARSSPLSPATAATLFAIQESISASKTRMFAPKDCVKEWNDFECYQKRIQRDRALHGYNCLSSRDQNTSYCNRKESAARAQAAAEQRRQEAKRIATEQQRQAAAAAAAGRQAEQQRQAAVAAARQAEQQREAAAAAARQAEQQRQAREDAARRRPYDR
jgi:hypothetical protein